MLDILLLIPCDDDACLEQHSAELIFILVSQILLCFILSVCVRAQNAIEAVIPVENDKCTQINLIVIYLVVVLNKHENTKYIVVVD